MWGDIGRGEDTIDHLLSKQSPDGFVLHYEQVNESGWHLMNVWAWKKARCFYSYLCGCGLSLSLEFFS